VSGPDNLTSAAAAGPRRSYDHRSWERAGDV